MTDTQSTAPAGTTENPMRRRQGETVLITGASSGIGRELARLFASDGADLVLIARSEGRLRELADELAAKYGAVAQVVPADLSRAASPGEIAEALTQRHIEVDVLVNNAGFGAHGPIAKIGIERQLEMIEVNVAALTRLTAMLLPGMLERRRGAILNVASTAAAPTPCRVRARWRASSRPQRAAGNARTPGRAELQLPALVPVATHPGPVSAAVTARPC